MKELLGQNEVVVMYIISKNLQHSVEEISFKAYALKDPKSD